MKKIFLTIGMVSLITANVIAAPGDPGTGINGSVHDMNVALNNTLLEDPQGRTCAFCHTPHHAVDPTTNPDIDYMPLWSHDLTTQLSFTSYDSVTFQGKLNTGIAVDPLIGPSRLCMSCHDGTVAPDQHYGIAGSILFNQQVDDEYNGISVGLNGNFANDHPIGFVFPDAVDADNATYGANPSIGFNFTSADIFAGTALWPVNANGYQIPILNTLYEGLDGQLYMTCATCHDVHNKDNVDQITGALALNKNYLAYGRQEGSEICLVCHNK